MSVVVVKGREDHTDAWQQRDARVRAPAEWQSSPCGPDLLVLSAYGLAGILFTCCQQTGTAENEFYAKGAPCMLPNSPFSIKEGQEI